MLHSQKKMIILRDDTQFTDTLWRGCLYRVALWKHLGSNCGSEPTGVRYLPKCMWKTPYAHPETHEGQCTEIKGCPEQVKAMSQGNMAITANETCLYIQINGCWDKNIHLSNCTSLSSLPGLRGISCGWLVPLIRALGLFLFHRWSTSLKHRFREGMWKCSCRKVIKSIGWLSLFLYFI